MERSRADLINAVLNSGWGQLARPQDQRNHATDSSWGVEATQNQAVGRRENGAPTLRQSPKIDVQAAQRQVGQINTHIETRPLTRSHAPPIVKSEPEPEKFEMQSITVYQPAGTQTAPPTKPEQARTIPVYRPHLGPRSQFEKRYGLPPGGSYTAGRNPGAQSQVAKVKQEVVEDVKQQVKQEGDALRETTNGHPQYGTQCQAGSYASPSSASAEDESAWCKADNLSYQQQPQGSSPPVKQEINASPNVTITMEHRIRTQATAKFSPTTSKGLAASRYASNPHSHQRPATAQIPKNEAALHRQPSLHTTQHIYGGQTLADPMAFMSAVNAESRNRQQTPQAPTPSPVPQAQPEPQPSAAKKPSPPQPILPAKDTEYSDEAYTDFLGTKAYGNRYQSPSVYQSPAEYQPPSRWPAFPSSTQSNHMHHMGSAARWGNDPTVSVAMASPDDLPQPAPTAATRPLPANHAKSTREWKKFATVEAKKNWQPTHVGEKPPPTQWSNDDPPAPTLTKVAPPKLVAASKHHGYETATQKQNTPAPSIAPAPLAQPNDKPLSEVVNADKVKIKALEAELEEQGSRLETIEQELEAYKEERFEMDRELEAYRAESGYTKELQERFKTLQAEYDALKATKAVVPAASAVNSGGDDPRLEWLETRNRELQLEVHLKEPLFQIGKDVRTRYLEEARSSQLTVARRELDKAAIERGNAAVYNGVSEADAAVLNGGFLTNLQLKNLTPVFKTLYGDDPKEFYKLSAKMREAMDAYATIQTSAALNSKHPNLPLQELKIIEGTVRLMGLKHNEMGTEAFEADGGGHAARALEKVKEAMVPCLKFDRKWDRLAIKEKLARDGNGSSTQSPEKGGAPAKQ
ncbi:hypothetical protein BDZ45DRAFT_695060 [Acephala macrosclerotiorum]|nr:hypothetical protein BDZ45DRAFT_695060 [Acephala macrosclerotiorum]